MLYKSVLILAQSQTKYNKKDKAYNAMIELFRNLISNVNEAIKIKKLKTIPTL